MNDPEHTKPPPENPLIIRIGESGPRRPNLRERFGQPPEINGTEAYLKEIAESPLRAAEGLMAACYGALCNEKNLPPATSGLYEKLQQKYPVSSLMGTFESHEGEGDDIRTDLGMVSRLVACHIVLASRSLPYTIGNLPEFNHQVPDGMDHLRVDAISKMSTLDDFQYMSDSPYKQLLTALVMDQHSARPSTLLKLVKTIDEQVMRIVVASTPIATIFEEVAGEYQDRYGAELFSKLSENFSIATDPTSDSRHIESSAKGLKARVAGRLERTMRQEALTQLIQRASERRVAFCDNLQQERFRVEYKAGFRIVTREVRDDGSERITVSAPRTPRGEKPWQIVPYYGMRNFAGKMERDGYVVDELEYQPEIVNHTDEINNVIWMGYPSATAVVRKR